MSTTMKISKSHQGNGYGWTGFIVTGIAANAKITAEYHIGNVLLPVPVDITSVGLPACDDTPLYVVSYPLCGTHEEQLVRIYANGKRIGTIPVTAQPDYVGRIMNHFMPQPGTSEIPNLHLMRKSERVSVELLGFLPVDSEKMVVRMRVRIPAKLAKLNWSFSLIEDVYSNHFVQAQVLFDERDSSGTRTAVVSCHVPRATTRALFTVTEPTKRHLPGFLGISKRVRDVELGKFYRLTTDAKADPNYPAWFALHRATQDQLERQRNAKLENMPLISIITPVFEPPLGFFDAYIQSVLAQTYDNWELVLAFASPSDEKANAYLDGLSDSRVRIVRLDHNLGIAGNTNAGIAHARGEYFAFIDQDDIIEPNTLFEYVRAINDNPGCDLLYCDEDGFRGDLSNLFEPMFKPDFNREFLNSLNYICHMLMVSRRAYENIVPSPDYTSGAQDYDLALKVSEVARKIVHIPRVLYHWRQHAKSTNAGGSADAGGAAAKPYAHEAGRRTLADYAKREGYSSIAKDGDTPFRYRLVYSLSKDSIKTSFVDLKTGSYDPSADILLLVSEDIRESSESSFETMLGYFQRPEVGAVGPLIFDEDGPIRHAGLALMANGTIARMNLGHTLETNKGYLGATESARNYTAVSLDCMAVRRELFESAGGIDTALSGDRAALDLCWKIRKAGYLVVYTPYACFTQRWSEKKAEPTCEKRELAILRLRYPELFENGDPALNPNCDPNSPYFALQPL